jgi:hypothetical protein
MDNTEYSCTPESAAGAGAEDEAVCLTLYRNRNVCGTGADAFVDEKLDPNIC